MSQGTITLITTPTTRTELRDEAQRQLEANGVVVVIQNFPENFSEWFNCPAIRIPSGRLICGIDGIRMFVSKELRGAS
jgi:hypothetical protein